ncbi:hypothetical protein [Nannocystis pusilla]|uniref:hypothetical protein n=1 Tax=Nannocystis pusilla TaxID=889268 RepID=UPI003B7EE90D
MSTTPPVSRSRLTRCTAENCSRCGSPRRGTSRIAVSVTRIARWLNCSRTSHSSIGDSSTAIGRHRSANGWSQNSGASRLATSSTAALMPPIHASGRRS